MGNIQIQPKNILIIQTAYLGDVILITPLIRATKEWFPYAAIDVLVIPQSSQALANNPYIRNVLLFDKRKHKFKAFVNTIRQIRKGRYDLAISPHSSLTTALIMVLGSIKHRLGFDRWLAARLLTMKVPHLKNTHKINKNLHLLSVFTDRAFGRQTEIYPSESSLKKYGRLSSGLPFDDGPLLAIAPGSIWFTKKWPYEYYKKLANMLYREQFNLIFIGSPEEKALCEQIIEESGIEALNFAGKTTILESAAVIKQCRLLICNDSGAMHIANAVGTDVFAVFGPTVRSIGYFPYRANDKVFEVDLECRPCSKHGGDECPLKHHRCMFDVKPEWIYREVQKRFQRKDGSESKQNAGIA